MTLQGKIALITGAAQGIGAATARLLAGRGARVVLTDIDYDGVTALARDIGPAAFAQALDVTDEVQTQAVLAAISAQFGRLDIAVLNAGTEGRIAPIGDLTLADYDRVMTVNVRSVFIGLSGLMPLMAAQNGGSIVILSSVGGARGSAGLAAYNTSKHAVIGLMRAAALEGGPKGVRVNTVNPGAVDTRMMQAIEAARGTEGAAARRAETEQSNPMKRYATASEVAAMIGFLASDDASFCNGNTYFVDGGAMAGLSGKS